MTIKIKGTETTKNLITSIVNDLRVKKGSIKPTPSDIIPTGSKLNARQIQYDIDLVDSKDTYELSTYEQADGFRNISVLELYGKSFNKGLFYKGILAVIGNTSGNIIIHEKPLFLSKTKALKKIQGFLANIQPKTMKTADNYLVTIDGNGAELHSDFKKHKVSHKIMYRNNTSSYEASEEYKTL